MQTSSKLAKKKIEIPLNNHVTLRVQSNFPLCNKDLAKLNTIYTRALRYLNYVLSELENLQLGLKNQAAAQPIPKHLCLKHNKLLELLTTHFNCAMKFTTGKWGDLLSFLIKSIQAMQVGMYAQQSQLIITNSSQKRRRNGWALVNGYIRGNKKGGIHLNLQMLDGNINDCVHTLVHEASHLFAGAKDYNIHYQSTGDYADKTINFLYGLFSGTMNTLAQMDAQQRMSHADSISNFIVEIASKALASNVNLDTALVDRELVKTDVEKTFTAPKPWLTHYTAPRLCRYIITIELGLLAAVELSAIVRPYL